MAPGGGETTAAISFSSSAVRLRRKAFRHCLEHLLIQEECCIRLRAAKGDAAELSRPPGRRRVVHPMPAICPCCNSDKLSKMERMSPRPVGYLFLGMVVFAVRPELLSAGGTVHLLAELGVVFLPFDIGAHFSTAHVRHEAGDIFGFGSL
jgi:hypothetical protein